MANHGSNNVIIINTASNTITGAITAGFNGPEGVAISPDGSYAYVVNQGSNNVVIINTTTNTVINSITSGFSAPQRVAFSPSGTYAYVTNCNTPCGNNIAGNVVIINTATNTVVNSITSGFTEPTGVAFSPSGTYAYVANHYTGNVVYINTATNTVINSINIGPVNLEGVAFSPSGTYAYVAYSYYAGPLGVIDTATNTVTSYVPAYAGSSNPTGVAFSPSGTYAYVLVDVGLGEYVEAVAPDIELAEVHVGAVDPVMVYHWYEYDGVPPDGCEVRVVDWPESITVFVAVGVPADSAGLSVMVPDFTEFSVSGVDALSVTITFVCTVLPASALGNAHVKLFDVDDTPV